MDEAELVSQLQYFYTLESQQIEMYAAQSQAVDDVYFSRVLFRTSEIEQEHVGNLERLIRELGGAPTILGDALGSISGRITGAITSHIGLVAMLKANVTLEKKAITDYKALIAKVTDRETFSLLWTHLVDEDLHTTWFVNKMAELEALEP